MKHKVFRFLVCLVVVLSMLGLGTAALAADPGTPGTGPQPDTAGPVPTTASASATALNLLLLKAVI